MGLLKLTWNFQNYLWMVMYVWVIMYVTYVLWWVYRIPYTYLICFNGGGRGGDIEGCSQYRWAVALRAS